MFKWLGNLFHVQGKEPDVPPTPSGVGPAEASAIVSNDVFDVLDVDGNVKIIPGPTNV